MLSSVPSVVRIAAGLVILAALISASASCPSSESARDRCAADMFGMASREEVPKGREATESVFVASQGCRRACAVPRKWSDIIAELREARPTAAHPFARIRLEQLADEIAADLADAKAAQDAEVDCPLRHPLR